MTALERGQEELILRPDDYELVAQSSSYSILELNHTSRDNCPDEGGTLCRGCAQFWHLCLYPKVNFWEIRLYDNDVF